MITTIDGAGRVVIPKLLRERLRLTAGTEVDIVEVDGAIEIRLPPSLSEWTGPATCPGLWRRKARPS